MHGRCEDPSMPAKPEDRALLRLGLGSFVPSYLRRPVADMKLACSKSLQRVIGRFWSSGSVSTHSTRHHSQCALFFPLLHLGIYLLNCKRYPSTSPSLPLLLCISFHAEKAHTEKTKLFPICIEDLPPLNFWQLDACFSRRQVNRRGCQTRWLMCKVQELGLSRAVLRCAIARFASSEARGCVNTSSACMYVMQRVYGKFACTWKPSVFSIRCSVSKRKLGGARMSLQRRSTFLPCSLLARFP